MAPRDNRTGAWRLWDLQRNQPISQGTLEAPIVGATFTEDEIGILAWASFFSAWGRTAGYARLWNAREGSPRTPILEHRAGVGFARLIRDETRLVTISESDGLADLWDAKDGRLLADLRHPADIKERYLTKDQTRLILLSKKDLRVWNLEDGSLIGSPMEQEKAPGDSYGMVEMGRMFVDENDGLIYVVTGMGSLNVYDLKDASLVVRFLGFEHQVKAAAFGRRNGQTTVLTIGGANFDSFIVSSFSLPRYEIAPDRLRLRVESRTGTVVDEFGNLRFLSRTEWLDRRHRLGDDRDPVK